MKSRESLVRLKRFQVDERRRQVAQIETMVAEFHRMAEELDRQVTAEQERVGIDDVSHFAYPTFAKAAIQRRDNLLASAAELQGNFQAAQDALTDALEELRKYEQLEEREQGRGSSDAAERDAPDTVGGQMAGY